MKLSHYGVDLVRLTKNDLELVRGWRNSEYIRNRMIYREYITPEMQEQWFSKINNYQNFYYIIRYQQKNIGLIQNKNTDWKKGSTESGLFIADKNFINTHIPVAASCILLEAGFFILNGKDSKIQVLSTNKKAQIYNEMLGYVKTDENYKEGWIEYQLNKEVFKQKITFFKSKLGISSSVEDLTYKVELSALDFENEVGFEVEKVMHNLVLQNKADFSENNSVKTWFIQSFDQF